LFCDKEIRGGIHYLKMYGKILENTKRKCLRELSLNIFVRPHQLLSLAYQVPQERV
jgi:hypothetical protein